MNDDDQPDASLVERAVIDPTAFAVLYRRYVDAIYGYCIRRLGTREAAEDATSRVFLQALSALPRYRSDAGSFRAWLFTIAHHATIDERRRYAKTIEVEVIEVEDDSPSLDDQLVCHERDRSVREILTRLGPEQRRVLELRLAGLTTTEIAAVLNRRRDAVEMAQYRGFARLRQLIAMSELMKER
jgi:RNA polymerase sigma-70 factor, ECF subfamily